MTGLVGYQFDDGVGTITMDDGKVNALSPGMLAGIGAAFDRAESDDAVVVLTGRPGVFSAGFDLTVLRAGGDDALAMLRGGFELAARLLSFPRPVVIACTGHAIAMGAFLLLSGDYLIGAAGEFRLTANEVAIGLTLPYAAAAICRRRLAPAHFNRVTTLADIYSPASAIEAGFLDEVVAGPDLAGAAFAAAQRLRALPGPAFAATKLRICEPVLGAVRAGIEAEYGSPIPAAAADR